jgi:hypothetical protein
LRADVYHSIRDLRVEEIAETEVWIRRGGNKVIALEKICEQMI